jgi:hypothetical protein
MYKDVIEKDQEIRLQLSPENVVHARLKGCWDVGQPEGHDQEIRMPKVAFKGGLLDVLLSNVDLVIT